MSRAKEEGLRSLADDRFIFIKKADKGFYVVVPDMWKYIKQSEKKHTDSTVYGGVNYNKKIVSQLFTQVMYSLRNSAVVVTFPKRYFTFEFKTACYLGKLYLLL